MTRLGYFWKAFLQIFLQKKPKYLSHLGIFEKVTIYAKLQCLLFGQLLWKFGLLQIPPSGHTDPKTLFLFPLAFILHLRLELFQLHFKKKIIISTHLTYGYQNDRPVKRPRPKINRQHMPNFLVRLLNAVQVIEILWFKKLNSWSLLLTMRQGT